ncbi:hypothetical protein BKA82DRAFT_25367 [Pisolithus tinctorius]|uniref:Uncharacterized protein n=1 Tax=Pisolithus tinctorius Marx 270 TaxID=870435 RepID=A0A0C3K7U8_PISTI|nr:hypothetical protein BKA82DRAFT_25367 [Pisolithus tinctorius]KIO05662.1 hypothetical protein M404DRAFT_25367 [Pisolithus tinctorius Marx 270]
MGLSKKEFFNHLKVCGIHKLTNQKLDTSRMITQQKNKLLIEKVIFQAQLEYKIFQKYENTWPVRDLLAQYLCNSSQLEKKATSNLEHRIGKQKAEEICGDKESDFWDANEDVSITDFDCLHSETDSPSEASDNSIGEDPSEDGHDSNEDEDNDMALVKRNSTHLPASETAVGRSIKIMNASSPPSEDEEKDDTDYHKLATIADDDDSPIASHQLPKMCPGMDCKDAIPNNISNQLKTALSTYIGLVKERKTNIHLETDISFKVAEAKGWPATKIEFKDIPSCILEMYDELEKLLFDAEACNNLWLWTCFEADLKQYGKTHAADTTVRKPLSLLQYLTYFVIPHVICWFIAQDFGLLLTMPAHSIMVESNDVGELINPKHNDNDELDQIKCTMTFALKQRNLGS